MNEEAVVYGANMVYNGEVTFEDIVKMVSLRSLLTGTDVVAVVRALVDNISLNILASRTVRLDGFGTFGLGISTGQANSEDEFTWGLLRKSRYTFRPSMSVKSVLQSALNGITKLNSKKDKEASEEQA